MVNFIRLMCAVFSLADSGDPSANQVSSRLGKELERALKGRSVTLRGSIHQNPMTYYELGDNVYYYAHSRLGKGRVSFSAPLHTPPVNRAAFDAGFALCFKTGSETEVAASFVGNTRSRMFHVASRNHLPDDDSRQSFHTRADEVVTLEMSCQRRTTAAVARRFSLDPTQVLGKVYATADIGKPRKLKDIIFVTAEGRKIKPDNREDSLIGPYEDQGFLLRGNLQQTLDELDVKAVKVNLDGAKLKWQLVRK